MEIADTVTNCRCGLPLRTVHCPHCGSKYVYSKRGAGGKILLPDNTEQIIRGWHCRRCDRDFNELTQCTVPYREDPARKTQQEKQERMARIQAIAEAEAVGITDPHEARLAKIRGMFKAQGLGALIEHTVAAPKAAEPDPEPTPRASDEDNYVDPWAPGGEFNPIKREDKDK